MQIKPLSVDGGGGGGGPKKRLYLSYLQKRKPDHEWRTRSRLASNIGRQENRVRVRTFFNGCDRTYIDRTGYNRKSATSTEEETAWSRTENLTHRQRLFSKGKGEGGSTVGSFKNAKTKLEKKRGELSSRHQDQQTLILP